MKLSFYFEDGDKLFYLRNYLFILLIVGKLRERFPIWMVVSRKKMEEGRMQWTIGRKRRKQKRRSKGRRTWK